MNFYREKFIGAGGDVANVDVDRVEQQFRDLARKHGVDPDVVDALVEFEKQRLGLTS